MKKCILILLALWLSVAFTGIWPACNAANALMVPKRAPSSDYTYTYKGVKYTYITENNYTRFFNLSVHKPSDYGWYPDADGWYVNAEKDYITADGTISDVIIAWGGNSDNDDPNRDTEMTSDGATGTTRGGM